MSDIGQLERNKDKFLEYKTYFENEIARKSKHIKHTDDECHFVRYTVSELFQKKQDELRSPFLGLETPSIRIKNNGGHNTHAVWRGAIVIGHSFEKGNTKDRDTQLDKCFYIFIKIIAKMHNEARALRIVKFDLDNLQANPVLELFGDDRVGVRWEFEMNSQFDLGYYEQDWLDVDEATPQPPLATVTDGSNDIELFQGDSYTCSTSAGTFTLKDSDGNVIATYTVSPGSEEEGTAPDGDARINSTDIGAYGKVPSNGEKNIEVVNTANANVGSLDAGKWKVPNGAVTAKNSADDVLGTASVTSGGAAEINVADVGHTQSDGSTETLPAGVPIICTPPDYGTRITSLLRRQYCSEALGAFSLVRYVDDEWAAAGNPIVYITRTGDLLEQGFTPAQILDGTATAWVVAGGGTQIGRVRVPDQTGNAFELFNTTTSFQWELITGGVMNVDDNALPTAVLTSTDGYDIGGQNMVNSALSLFSDVGSAWWVGKKASSTVISRLMTAGGNPAIGIADTTNFDNSNGSGTPTFIVNGVEMADTKRSTLQAAMNGVDASIFCHGVQWTASGTWRTYTSTSIMQNFQPGSTFSEFVFSKRDWGSAAIKALILNDLDTFYNR